MKTARTDTNRNRGLLPACIISALLAMTTVPASAGQGNQGNPGILPPQSHPHGHTYGEWAAAWWQWALSIPADRNPLTDETGEFCHEGQAGSVWFLAGTFGTDVERSCTIPTGKTIFMPLYNWIFGAGVFDCEPTVPDTPCNIEDLQAGAAANTEAAEVLEVTIDGVPVQNVWAYRAASPGPFDLNLPAGNIIGLPAGTYFPQVTDGYWLMLKPFSPGEHTIRIYVRAPETSFGLLEFEVVYHLTVE